MLKKKNSLYVKGRPKGCWYKWKRNPFFIDFIIMYAQRGHGKRSSFYSDFTFGCWTDNSFKNLVPVGKAYSGFTNEELKDLDRWVRSNTLERFGPVRSVKSSLVVEIAFDNINFSNGGFSSLAKPSGNATAYDYVLSMNTSGAARWANTLDGGTF